MRICVAQQASAPVQPEVLIEQAVHTDLVTGFYHRHRFRELLEQRLASDSRGGVRALVYLKPDSFGKVKEEIGTFASEDILARLATLLREQMQSNDLYGRFGGTMFAALVERGNLRDAEAWSEHVVAHIAKQIFEVRDQSVSLTCTVGVADAGGHDTLEALFDAVESAQSLGRQRGGNQVIVDQPTDADTRAQQYDPIWVKHIKAALMDNRFRLVHLPIASLQGDGEQMFDILLRMVDVQGNEVLPTEFIPAARRNHLMKNVDRWVIGAAMSYSAARNPGTLFVRLSKDSIVDDTLPEWLTRQINMHQVTANDICFQVAEEDATNHLKQTKMLIEALHERDCRVAIEHFGVGRDPTQLLEHLTMDFVKIDGSLMQGLASNQVAQQKVRGLVEAARQHEVLTIAEHIEDANTMAVLQLGVAFMQGHYLQEPEVVLEEHGQQRRPA